MAVAARARAGGAVFTIFVRYWTRRAHGALNLVTTLHWYQHHCEDFAMDFAWAVAWL
jgi:hypothetical protein